jgi:hypothetical protein
LGNALSLGGNQITDAGLEHLKGFTIIGSLDLTGTQVTDAGVKKLQEALTQNRAEWSSANCRIVH